MLKRLFSPIILIALILAGCQTPQGKFTPEQVAAMKSYGFTESAGDWSLGLTTFYLIKTTISYARKASSKSARWPPGWQPPG